MQSFLGSAVVNASLVYKKKKFSESLDAENISGALALMAWCSDIDVVYGLCESMTARKIPMIVAHTYFCFSSHRLVNPAGAWSGL